MLARTQILADRLLFHALPINNSGRYFFAFKLPTFSLKLISPCEPRCCTSRTARCESSFLASPPAEDRPPCCRSAPRSRCRRWSKNLDDPKSTGCAWRCHRRTCGSRETRDSTRRQISSAIKEKTVLLRVQCNVNRNLLRLRHRAWAWPGPTDNRPRHKIAPPFSFFAFPEKLWRRPNLKESCLSFPLILNAWLFDIFSLFFF